MHLGQLILLMLASTALATSDSKEAPTVKNTKVVTDKVYAKIFARNREEQQTLLRHIVSLRDDYAKQYKLLQVGLLKILELLAQSRDVLAAASFDPKRDRFPSTEPLIEAVSTVLENTCLFGDLVLHTPDVSARILEKKRAAAGDWRELLAWSTAFTANYYGDIVDARTQQMLGLFDQECNPERRQPDFVNPYRSRSDEKPAGQAKPTKERRKIRKGPQLTAGRNEL